MGITGSRSTESFDGYQDGGNNEYNRHHDEEFNANNENTSMAYPAVTAKELAEVDRDNKIPMVFRFNGPGQEAKLAGTFTGW